jgi:hypothetical protein
MTKQQESVLLGLFEVGLSMAELKAENQSLKKLNEQLENSNSILIKQLEEMRKLIEIQNYINK